MSSVFIRAAVRAVAFLGLSMICEEDASAKESAAIYRCNSNGVLTFADRPCGEAAETHRASDFATNTYEAPDRTNPVESRAPPRKPKAAKSVPNPKHQADACDRLDRSLKEIRSKMRAGYSAAQGERLKERQTKLRSQQRRARCS